ncbi:MAG: ABC transporter ATP-binding protein [Gammaproteobacteria bacterium]|nr:ABC transporter ATP-binding protein [Gammaproteobacteria bacterium]
MLEIDNIETSYGESQVLFGVSLSVNEGHVVTLLGRNGMGKTTTINSLMGIVRARSGSIRFNGQDITGLPMHRIARAGIGLVPEGRQIFPNLSTWENLVATAGNHQNRPDPWTLEGVLEFFPVLKTRLGNLGGQLSGGEQQMLAIGRALMLNPSLLVLDEATEGLAPLIRGEIWARLRLLKEQGQSILVIDKNLSALIELADWHYVIEKGRIVWQGDSAQLSASQEVKSRYLGV